MTGDHGSSNSWGRDRFWHPNRGALDQITSQHPELILLDAVEPTIIRNSRWRCDHGWDIDLDDGSSNYEVYNNLCLAGGIKLREGFHRHVHNNIILTDSIHPHVWFNDSHDTIEHNIVMTWYRPIRVPRWGDKVDNNLLPDSAALARSHALSLDKNSLAGEPQFIDPANDGFRVSADSPALEVGFKNFPMDRFGVRRDSLRSIAGTRVIPALGVAPSSNGTKPYVFLGATVKKLQERGERSATGMTRNAALVLFVPEDAAAGRCGLQENDVLLHIGSCGIKHPTQFQAAYLKTNSNEKCDFILFRNQQEKIITVPGVLAVRLEAADATSVGSTDVLTYNRRADVLEGPLSDEATIRWNPTIYGSVVMDVYLTSDGSEEAMQGLWSFEIAAQTIEVDIAHADGDRHYLGRVRFERYGVVSAKLRKVGARVSSPVRLRALTLERRP